jgi:outer membrane autotransporter protein
MEGGSYGSGETYDGSITLKQLAGPWLFAGSFAWAHGAYEAYRHVNLPGSPTLRSDPSIFMTGGRLRAGYQFAFGDWYVQPYGDLDVLYTHLPGVTERGSPLYALDLNDSDKTTVGLSFMVELGGRLKPDTETTLRPYATFGLSYLPDNTRAFETRFVSEVSDNGRFMDYLESPEVLGRIDVGLQVYRAGGFDVKAGYSADVGGTFLSQTASARLSYHF